MALITNIQDMQKTGVTDNALTPTVFIPYVESVEETYITKILGDELYDELSDQHRANTKSPENVKLWEKVIKAVGPLAKYKLTPEVATRLSNNGARVVESNDNNPASNTEIYFLRQSLLTNGYNALESIYKFLFKNKADYPLWTASPEYKKFRKHFISSAEQFNEYVMINSSYWLYAQFIPFMTEIEKRYIMGAITQDLFTDLKTKWLDDSLSIVEKELHANLCRAIAQLTYAMALKSPFLRQEIQNVIAGKSEGTNKFTLGKEEFAALIFEHETLAQAAIGDAIKYLNENASDTIFPIWFTSNKYISPTQMIADKGAGAYGNNNSNSTFCAL